MNSRREWASMLDATDAVLKHNHGITTVNDRAPGYTLPLVANFRTAYGTILSRRPDTIEECNADIEDMMTTLRTIRALDEITPFGGAQTRNYQLQDSVSHKPGTKHVSQMVHTERITIEQWNERRAKLQKKNVAPWDEARYRNLLEDRPDVLMRRFFENGVASTIGQYVLREVKNDPRAYDLIDFAASPDIPGLSDHMVGVLLQEMRGCQRKRLINAIEESH